MGAHCDAQAPPHEQRREQQPRHGAEEEHRRGDCFPTGAQVVRRRECQRPGQCGDGYGHVLRDQDHLQQQTEHTEDGQPEQHFLVDARTDVPHHLTGGRGLEADGMSWHADTVEKRKEVPAECPHSDGKNQAFEDHAEQGGKLLLRAFLPIPGRGPAKECQQQDRQRPREVHTSRYQLRTHPGIGPVAQFHRRGLRCQQQHAALVDDEQRQDEHERRERMPGRFQIVGHGAAFMGGRTSR